MKLSRFFVILVFLFSNSCSYYSLTGSIPLHLKTVVIQPTINNTSEYDIGKKIERMFSDILINKNLLSITSYEKADCQLQFSVKKIYDEPYVIDEARNTTTVKQWKIDVILSIEWYDLVNQISIINKDISESIIYSLDNNSLLNQNDNQFEYVSNREAAIQKCIENLSNRIINELTSTW